MLNRSWVVSHLKAGEYPVTEIGICSSQATNYIQTNVESQDILRNAINHIEKNHDDRDLLEVISSLLSHVGILRTLEMVFSFNEIDIGSPKNSKELFTAYEQDTPHLFIVELSKTYVKIGDWQGAKPDRIKKLIDILASGNEKAITSVLKTTSYHLQEQIDISKEIIRLTEPILQDNSRWNSRAVFVNYGKSSLVLWPEATLETKDSTGATFLCKCVLTQHDFQPIERLIVIPSDGSLELNIITAVLHKDIARSQALMDMYVAGYGHARIKFKITHRNNPKGNPFYSEWITFGMEKINVMNQKEISNT
jgi:hypothetical protein